MYIVIPSYTVLDRQSYFCRVAADEGHYLTLQFYFCKKHSRHDLYMGATFPTPLVLWCHKLHMLYGLWSFYTHVIMEYTIMLCMPLRVYGICTRSYTQWLWSWTIYIATYTAVHHA